MRWQQFLRPETSMCIQFFWVMLNNLLMIKTWAVLQVRLLNSIACLFNMSENNCMPCLTKCFVILLNIKLKHFFCSSLLSCHFFLTFPFQGLQKLTLASCVFYPSTDNVCQVPSWLNLSVSESEEYVWNTSFLQLLKKKKNKSLVLGNHLFLSSNAVLLLVSSKNHDLCRSNTENLRFTDIPSFCACSVSSLINLIGWKSGYPCTAVRFPFRGTRITLALGTRLAKKYETNSLDMLRKFDSDFF